MYYLLIIIMCIFSSSAIPLTIYENARYESNIFDTFQRSLTGIVSRDQCACQCHFDQWCVLASYSVLDQQCSMFSTQLYQGQLHVVSINRQSSVLYFSNKTSPSK